MRPARPDEVETVLDVLADASAWLRARGIDQWPERFERDWVMPAIERGETWLAERDGEVVGTLVVQWEDPIFWASYPKDAWYLHRMAVRRRGTGLGAQLLRWAEAHTAGAGKGSFVWTAWHGTSRCARTTSAPGTSASAMSP